MSRILTDPMMQTPTVRIERVSREALRRAFNNDPESFINIIRSQNFQTASKSEIEKLEKAYRKDLLGQQCSICLCKYKRSETALSMPCKHNFHEICLKTWLARSNFCPLCKFELKTDNDMYELYREEMMLQQTRENSIAEH